MNRYDPYTDTFIQEGWVCPRCGQVMAPWMPYCNCKIEVKYTKETSTTAPTGQSYTINPSSTTVTYPNPDYKSTKTVFDGSHLAGRTIIDGWENELFMDSVRNAFQKKSDLPFED